LARPVGNVTGFSNMAAETAGKSVELFRDMLPSIGRVAALANPADPFTTPFLEQIRLAGRLPGFASSLSRWPEDLKKQKPHSPQYPKRLSLFREFSFPKLLLSWH
jgi:hypothetical protein